SKPRPATGRRPVGKPPRSKRGSDHPDTLASMANLATLYASGGQFTEAEPMYKQVVEGCRARFGADHPATFQSRHNLASLYSDWGRYDEAERRFPQLLEEARRVQLGDDPVANPTYMSSLS